MEIGNKELSHLPTGQVRTILEVYESETSHYLSEFADSNSKEYAVKILRSNEILALNYSLVVAAQRRMQPIQNHQR